MPSTPLANGGTPPLGGGERTEVTASTVASAVDDKPGVSMMEQLVPEITTHALSYLDYPSLCRLSMTNSLMRKAANDDNAWKALYHKVIRLTNHSFVLALIIGIQKLSLSVSDSRLKRCIFIIFRFMCVLMNGTLSLLCCLMLPLRDVCSIFFLLFSHLFTRILRWNKMV